MDEARPTSGQCARCIFKMAGRLACVAFPRSIPAAIISGVYDHTKPYEGDGGIGFVPLRGPRPLDPRPASPAAR